MKKIEDMKIVYLSVDQIDNLVDFVEQYFFSAIREDDSIDNIAWAQSLMSALASLTEAKEDG